jgi:hypothetical protein
VTIPGFEDGKISVEIEGFEGEILIAIKSLPFELLGCGMIDFKEANIRVFLVKSPGQGLVARSDHDDLTAARRDGPFDFLFDMGFSCQIMGDDSRKEEAFAESQKPAKESKSQSLAEEITCQELRKGFDSILRDQSR